MADTERTEETEAAEPDPERMTPEERLRYEAAWAVLMWDQADTGGAISAAPDGRVKLLRDAVEDLRAALGGDAKVREAAGPGTWRSSRIA